MNDHAAHVCCHLGYGYGAFARAQLGLLWDEETAVVPVTSRQPSPGSQATASTGGGASGLYFEAYAHVGFDDCVVESIRPFVSAERAKGRVRRQAQVIDTYGEEVDSYVIRPEELEVAVGQAALRAKDEGYRGRIGAALRSRSVAGHSETELARALLTAKQGDVLDAVTGYGSMVRSADLAGELMAAGLHAAIVAHGYEGRLLTHALVAVYADGAWHYADPNRKAFDLGQRAPFTAERVSTVPDLPVPRTHAEHALRMEAAAARMGATAEQLKAATEQLKAATANSEDVRLKVLEMEAAAAAIKQRKGMTGTEKFLLALATLGVVGLVAVLWVRSRKSPRRKRTRTVAKRLTSG